MTILEALQKTVQSIKTWSENKFLKNTDIDNSLNSTSTNPVQNKVINSKINELQGKIPSINGLATETYVNTKVANLVDSAPETLDTLNELSKALGNDPNFATTIATRIGTIETKVGNDPVSEQISNAIDDVTADDFGIYVQDSEPTNAEDGDIWIDTANDPATIDIDAPVKSVNGKIGNVVLTSSDVGAQPVGDYVLQSEIGSLASKNIVSKSDLDTSVQSSLNKADSALQSFTETDPTVPSWAKASTKPTYTKSEVGLGNVDNVKQYSASNPPPYPVTSVNGKTGAVTISALPVVTTSDNGKVLMVVNGAWQAVDLNMSIDANGVVSV